MTQQIERMYMQKNDRFTSKRELTLIAILKYANHSSLDRTQKKKRKEKKKDLINTY